MTIRCEVLSPWDFNGDPEPSNHPRLGDEHQLQGWTDVTGLPAVNMVPDPNNGCLLATMEDAAYDAIAADNTYWINWSEDITAEQETVAAGGNPQSTEAPLKDPNETPPANEWGLMRAYLAQQGFSQTWINDVLGSAQGTGSRADDANLLKVAMADL